MDLREIKENQNRHPWELSRREVVFSLVEDEDFRSVADIGAGDRFFIEELVARRQVIGYACDLHYSDDELGQEKPSLNIVRNIKDIPDELVGMVFLLDVLEHIEHEDEFLKEVRSRLQKTGKILLTVPAFQFLYGDHDLFLQHFRRYSKKNLEKVLVGNDLVVEKIFYFYSSLFLIKSFMKLLDKVGIKKKYKNEVSSWKYNENHFLTRFFVRLLNIDFHINNFLSSRLKIALPGLSLCAIVRKHA